MKARATSFATIKDLKAYIDCRDGGGSPQHCLSVGDNGTGAFGDNTATTHIAMCALPASEVTSRWGSTHAGRGKRVSVTLQNHLPIICELRDLGPSGVVDLNPGALLAAGLQVDTELNIPAEWEWVDDQPS